MPSYTRYPARYAATFQGLGASMATSKVGLMSSGITPIASSGITKDRGSKFSLAVAALKEGLAPLPEYVTNDPRYKKALADYESVAKDYLVVTDPKADPTVITGREVAPSDLPFPVLGSVDLQQVCDAIASFAKNENSVTQLKQFYDGSAFLAAFTGIKPDSSRFAAWCILRLPMFQGPWRRLVADGAVNTKLLNGQSAKFNLLYDEAKREYDWNESRGNAFAARASAPIQDPLSLRWLGGTVAAALRWAEKTGFAGQKDIIANRKRAVDVAKLSLGNASNLVMAERAATDAATAKAQEAAVKAAADAQAKLDEASAKQAELEAKLTKLEENKSTAESTIESGGFVLSKGVVIGAVAAVAIGGFLLYKKFKR